MNRAQAIKILDRATTTCESDAYWVDIMEDFGLYDKANDAWPSFYDVLMALGVSQKELDESAS